MTVFKFEVTLVAGSIGLNLDASFGSEPYEAFDYYFYNHGATEVEYHACPTLKPGAGSISKDSSFVGLEWDSDSELFEGSTAGYEIQNVSGDKILGWDYNYCLLISFIAQTSANSLEEAIGKVRSEALDSLLIYDGGMDETLEVEDVRLTFKTN
jgi:hypothetical protein